MEDCFQDRLRKQTFFVKILILLKQKNELVKTDLTKLNFVNFGFYFLFILKY